VAACFLGVLSDEIREVEGREGGGEERVLWISTVQGRGGEEERGSWNSVGIVIGGF